MNNKLQASALFTVLIAMIVSTGTAALAARKTVPTGETRNEFFIISEVRLKRQQLVLEKPSQITKVMFLNDKTVFESKKGDRLPFSDIRAGQTVFVTYVQEGGKALALTIRQGPMTVTMLHERYFNG
ncbi:MAG: hypothetical protein KGL59_12600 [Acidobacteriota bacterium]|nr:hypothetical protein [Acidobacteriota bacterium]